METLEIGMMTVPVPVSIGLPTTVFASIISFRFAKELSIMSLIFVCAICVYRTFLFEPKQSGPGLMIFLR